jgi:glycosyltransferase involved in cell wall biosynthesis
MTQSCSIFFYEGYVGVAPTIMNLAKSLNDCGYSVTIYATENHFPKPEKLGDKITVIYFKKVANLPLAPILIRLLDKFRLETLISVLKLIELVVYICNYFLSILTHNKANSLENDISIGVDTNGSTLALINAYFFRRSFIYLSLELNHPNSFKRLARIINVLERLAYRKSKSVIVQDEDRFKTLCEYNQYQHPKVFYLPNSDSSSDFLVQNAPIKNYFKELFNLSEEEFPHIILQAGIINDAVLAKELAHAFTPIRKGCALIFHEREKRKTDDPYIKSLREINSNNLFLSLEPLPYEQIDKIYASATIGLAFYKDWDNNLSQISKASGKLSQYLKHGKPVLVNNLESLSQVVEKYKIGVVIKDPLNTLEIEAAIETILNNYAFYSENAKACFEEEFDFAKKVKPILAFMADL